MWLCNVFEYAIREINGNDWSLFQLMDLSTKMAASLQMIASRLNFCTIVFYVVWLMINSLSSGGCSCILKLVILKLIKDRCIEHFVWNCPQLNLTRHRWWSRNIGSSNSLVQSDNKPLPEPMLTQISVAIWYHQDTISINWGKGLVWRAITQQSNISLSWTDLGVGGAVRFLVVGTIGQEERPPWGQLWMEQCLTSLKYWPI